jgi:flagellar export protein FliJ
MSNPPRWLSTLIQVRRQHRDACRRQLDEAVRAEAVLAEKSGEVQEQLAELTDFRRRTAAAEACDLNLLLAAQRHQAALKREQQSTTEQIELVQKEVDRRRSIVVAAEQQVRVLDKLSEQKVQQARRAEDRREAKRLDEVATIMRSTEAGSFGNESGSFGYEAGRSL